MWRLATAVAVATGPVLSGTVVATDKPKPAFDEVDADDNGKITIEEAAEAGVAKEEARRQDLDDDGTLTKNDWKYVGYDGT